MQKEMNIPLTIQEIGTITPDAYFAAVDKMADAALADACTPTNPRVPTKEDIIKIKVTFKSVNMKAKLKELTKNVELFCIDDPIEITR